jgi:hypothetical protein
MSRRGFNPPEENMGKSKKDEASENADDFDQGICEALLLKGWIVPQTAEEVLRVQDEFPDDREVLPEALRDAYAVLNRESAGPSAIAPLTAEDESVETMARAARLGGKISSEIEERMSHDRKRAEEDADDSQVS